MRRRVCIKIDGNREIQAVWIQGISNLYLNDNDNRTIQKPVGGNDSTKDGENDVRELTETIERSIWRQRSSENNDPDVKLKFCEALNFY